jgi:chorismate dehydratase
MSKLRLGHIHYSNCVPVHALALAGEGHGWLELREGTPAELNRALAAGDVDVAPSSSIEYARHAGRYRLLPGHVIASDGAVGSILLELSRPATALDGRLVALPTASATSVVLLRLLLERRLGVRPRYDWFEQRDAADPFATGADAVLWIGDVALRRAARTDRALLDLGAAWGDWTGLPFAYALWQVGAGPERDPQLARLAALLRRSKDHFRRHAASLAEAHAADYGLDAAALLAYWRTLRFDLDAEILRGLDAFLRLATEIGEAPGVPALHWVEAATG